MVIKGFMEIIMKLIGSESFIFFIVIISLIMVISLSYAIYRLCNNNKIDDDAKDDNVHYNEPYM